MIRFSRSSVVLVAFMLAACSRSQPTVEATNATTNTELDQIAAQTNSTDGVNMDDAILMGAPTIGQQMDAKEQPPKP